MLHIELGHIARNCKKKAGKKERTQVKSLSSHIYRVIICSSNLVLASRFISRFHLAAMIEDSRIIDIGPIPRRKIQ